MQPSESRRVLQIHPTRRCNLQCLHCYSSSSPHAQEALDLALLEHAILAAAGHGYGRISVSGGEPLLYKPLPELLAHARRCGLRTAVTSNGMLLDNRMIDRLGDLVDVLAISLDGIPASHDRIRGSNRAFDTMCLRLAGVRDAGLNFGFIFTLTQHNLDELDWVAEFAISEGAQLLQIHPLEAAGNAVSRLPGEVPDGIEEAYAWIVVQRLLHRLGKRLQIQVDLAHTEVIRKNPEMVYALPFEDYRERPLAALVSPLVIEADGRLAPIQYGFSEYFQFGNLKEWTFDALVARWRKTKAPTFSALCRELYNEIDRLPEPQFLNWYEYLGKAADQFVLSHHQSPSPEPTRVQLSRPALATLRP